MFRLVSHFGLVSKLNGDCASAVTYSGGIIAGWVETW